MNSIFQTQYRFRDLAAVIIFQLTLLFVFQSIEAQSNFSFRIIIAGDAVFGNNYPQELEELNLNYSIAEKGWDHHFEKLAPLLQSADAVLLNLKGPLTEKEKTPYVGLKTHIYKNPPAASIDALKKYNIKAVGLANNHTLDYGEDAFLQTLELLKTAGIRRVGAGKNKSKAAKAIHLRVGEKPMRFTCAVSSGFWYRARYSQVYNWYAKKNRPGVNKWNRDRIPEQIAAIKEESSSQFILAYPGYGVNYGWQNRYQTDLSHMLIDEGADIVIGHGAQKVQEIEFYKGKWIVYNLGNFVFVSPGYYEREEAISFSFLAALEGTANDNQQMELNLKLYPIHTNNMENGFQPRHATKKEAKMVWNEILKESENRETLKDKVQQGKDEFGPYYDLKIGTWSPEGGMN